MSSDHLVPIGSATGGGSKNRRTITSENRVLEARVTEKDRMTIDSKTYRVLPDKKVDLSE